MYIYSLLAIPYWLFLCLFAFAYAHAVGRACAPLHVLGPLSPPPAPRTDGPAAPAHGDAAWARPIACA